MKKLFCLFGVFCAVSLFSAEVMTGVVNLEKIFRDYYKSKIAEELIREQAKIYRDYLENLNKQLNEMQQEAGKLRLQTQNLALAQSAREAAGTQLEKLQHTLLAKKAEQELYVRGRTADMRKLENTKRAEIMADITEQISRSAAVFGYGFVLDSSGMTSNGRSALLLFPQGREFTEHVITELNRSQSKKAPAQSGDNKK